ncbi:glucose-1-phosphate adenylyltransferase [Arachidicoccus soli]|uniref:Glucose-1-phosphate adenylyltransferase n=1 Tax=Arachidicoccus soli TaxID=2341117 RepID=A0A386HQD0_9BACT|nr:glucose-1-phosphate adenylyltransferase [Arachidicoccus soli]AYD47869.1 glucose-1-phosphate adenylyltransferase [Arachidicoccus soli]
MSFISKNVVAVILGGGAGTRLYPLTATRSKPAVPIAGKYRLVDIPISNCMNSDILKMYVLTQFNSASLNKHIKNTYHFSAFSKGFVDIIAAEQTPDSSEWFQGTADAVRQSLRHLQNQSYEYILVLSGDQLYQIDFKEMFEKHIQSNAEISIATIPVNAKDATEFGIMKSNEHNEITSFIEKPAAELLPDWISDTGEKMQAEGRNYMASMGIYIFNKSIMGQLLMQVHPNAKDFGKEIIPSAIGKYRVNSFQYEGYWTDIGNISSFFEANLDLTNDIPSINLYDSDAAIYTRPRMLPAAKINSGCVTSSVIAEGSIILCESLERCIVGIRARIGSGSKLKSCYIMGNDYYETLASINAHKEKGEPPLGIGENCLIENAIIDKNVHIGNNVTIIGGPHLENQDHELYTVKDGIVVIKKMVTIPDGFELQ